MTQKYPNLRGEGEEKEQEGSDFLASLDKYRLPTNHSNQTGLAPSGGLFPQPNSSQAVNYGGPTVDPRNLTYLPRRNRSSPQIPIPVLPVTPANHGVVATPMPQSGYVPSIPASYTATPPYTSNASTSLRGTETDLTEVSSVHSNGTPNTVGNNHPHPSRGSRKKSPEVAQASSNQETIPGPPTNGADSSLQYVGAAIDNLPEADRLILPSNIEAFLMAYGVHINATPESWEIRILSSLIKTAEGKVETWFEQHWLDCLLPGAPNPVEEGHHLSGSTNNRTMWPGNTENGRAVNPVEEGHSLSGSANNRMAWPENPADRLATNPVRGHHSNGSANNEIIWPGNPENSCAINPVGGDHHLSGSNSNKMTWPETPENRRSINPVGGGHHNNGSNNNGMTWPENPADRLATNPVGGHHRSGGANNGMTCPRNLETGCAINPVEEGHHSTDNGRVWPGNPENRGATNPAGGHHRIGSANNGMTCPGKPENKCAGSGKHVCPLCGHTFTKKQDLKRHLHARNPPEVYHCHDCDFQHSRRDKAKKHITHVHPRVPEPWVETKEQSFPTVCDSCGEQSRSWKEWFNHLYQPHHKGSQSNMHDSSPSEGASDTELSQSVDSLDSSNRTDGQYGMPITQTPRRNSPQKAAGRKRPRKRRA